MQNLEKTWALIFYEYMSTERNEKPLKYISYKAIPKYKQLLQIVLGSLSPKLIEPAQVNKQKPFYFTI